MTTRKTVAKDLKGQLSRARKTKPRKFNVSKVAIEFEDRQDYSVYSYILFKRTNNFVNFSKHIVDTTSTKIDKPLDEMLEDILNKLDEPNKYRLVSYNSLSDMDYTDTFDEKGLKKLIKDLKRDVLNKMVSKE